jgi:hypothetical protein
MGFWNKRGRGPKSFDLPTVPDDAEERQREAIASAKRLQEAIKLRDRAAPTAETLRYHNRRNHYTRRMAETFIQGGLAG